MRLENQSQTLSEGIMQAPRPPKGTLKLPELYALSIGQVIGAGVITLVGPALGLTGYSAWLGYVLAIALGFIQIFPIILITSTVRMSGGFYSLIAATTNKKIAGMFAVSQLTTMVSLSLFGVSLGVYINSVFPSVNPTMCGVVLLTFFYVINLLGIDFMASAQKLMTWFLIAALLMFIAAGLMRLKNPVFDFSGPMFMTNGLNGLLTSMFLFVYSTTGYSLTMNYGYQAKNATRDIPRAILLSVPTIFILYVGVAIAGSGVLPLEMVVGKPLTLVAKETLPGVLFAAFIIGGPVMALTTTMNSSMPSQCIPMQRACEDGWFPTSFAAQNKRGAPWKILTLNYALGLVPMLLGFNVNTIISNIMLLSSVRSFLQIYTYYQIPKRYPDAWKKSFLHMPDALYYMFCTFSLIGQVFIFFYSARSLNPTIVTVSLTAIACCIVYSLVRSKSPSIQIRASVWPGADEDPPPQRNMSHISSLLDRMDAKIEAQNNLSISASPDPGNP